MKAARSARLTALLLATGGVLAMAVPTAALGQETATQSTRLTEAEIEALYHARTDSARMRFSQADVEFVTGMIGHHAQALIMSDLAPKNGASPQVQVLAARIINAQKDEIALMQRWLRDRGQPVPDVKIDGLQLTVEMPEAGGHDMHADHEMDAAPDMVGHAGHGDHAMMPGMLTQAELEELAAARGAEFDRLFLTGMIKHHGGAVTMVHELFETDGAGQDEAVFKLASDVQVDQTTEIARMTQMLEALD
jgi:uncharacterized protein (DUF305 family)